MVEGRDDTKRLQEYYDVMTIETNGSALSPVTLAEIQRAQDLYGVIVFTDPDISGSKIRQTITQAVKGVKHAFLTVDEARPSHRASLGVEHASFKSIDRALSQVYELAENVSNQPAISQADLYRLGLVASPQAADRRDYLTNRLRIGHVNGKQLAKRLNLFQIDIKQVEAILADFDE
ncbi:ribonuclease M5 [Aerococcus urinaehominis]|nr:ribonuclease M5 [Aerococcus urinaehominis]